MITNSRSTDSYMVPVADWRTALHRDPFDWPGLTRSRLAAFDLIPEEAPYVGERYTAGE
jgi:hypothetical protein